MLRLKLAARLEDVFRAKFPAGAGFGRVLSLQQKIIKNCGARAGRLAGFCRSCGSM